MASLRIDWVLVLLICLVYLEAAWLVAMLWKNNSLLINASE